MAESAGSDHEVHSRKPEWFFDGPSGRTRKEIWRWWQQRRYRYNRDILGVGIVTWFLALIAGSAAVRPGVDFEEPIMMILGPALYAVFANLGYTAGAILDLAIYRGSPRKHLFKVGYLGSLVLTASPDVWAVVAWPSTVISGKKLE